MQRPDLFIEVATVVLRELELDLDAQHVKLRPETSLVELGLDSLKAVDLAVGLEEALGIVEFPIQEWADAEAARDEPRYTIAALVSTCAAVLQAQRKEAMHDR